jgi:hypothetical protein
MGAMVVLFVTTPGATPEQFVASLRAGAQETILPMLELLTEGLLADRQMLDDYLEFLWEPPDGAQALVRPGSPSAAHAGAAPLGAPAPPDEGTRP